MKRILIIACLLLAAMPAQAISRYSSTSKSCAEVQAIIDRDGAAIMSYRSRNPDAPLLYDRYVAGRQFCSLNEVTERKYIPSSDDKSCQVERCIRFENEDQR